MAINEPTELDLSNRGKLTDELAKMDAAVRLQGKDEMATCFDPDTHPKAFDGMKGGDEPVADRQGNFVDVQAHTRKIGKDVGDTDRDIFKDPLPEFDDIGSLEPTEDDLMGDLL